MSQSITDKPEIVKIAGIPLTKYGSLTAKEAKWFNARRKHLLELMLTIYSITYEIAQTHGMSEDDAYDIVSNFGSATGSQVLIPYADRLKETTEILDLNDNELFDVCTMILSFRLKREAKEEIMSAMKINYGIDIMSCETWNDELTQSLPMHVVGAIAEFAKNELNQWKIVAKNVVPVVVDVNCTTNTLIYNEAHELNNGDPISVVSVIMPEGLFPGRTYYAIVKSSTEIKLAATEDYALAADPVVINILKPGVAVTVIKNEKEPNESDKTMGEESASAETK